MEKKKIIVEILGQECKIFANSPEEEQRVKKIADLIQVEAEHIIKKTGTSYMTALLYTALNLGDRWFCEIESTENLREQIARGAEAVEKLERELQKRQKGKEPPRGRAKKEADVEHDLKQELEEEAREARAARAAKEAREAQEAREAREIREAQLRQMAQAAKAMESVKGAEEEPEEVVSELIEGSAYLESTVRKDVPSPPKQGRKENFVSEEAKTRGKTRGEGPPQFADYLQGL